MIGEVLTAVREHAPLVHCLSAAVSLNFVADAVLAAGARPMMTETVEEAPTMVTAADAVLINLGTLSTDGTAGIPATAARAQELSKPWVLDPTAVGLAPVRTPLARKLLAHRPAVIRGNASEILHLAGANVAGRGADSAHTPQEAAQWADSLARATGAVVAVSGRRDIITSGSRSVGVGAGHSLLARVTGTGCALGALTAACAAVTDPFRAAHAATAWLCLAAEDAAAVASGPGSFKAALLDALDGLDAATIDERLAQCSI